MTQWGCLSSCLGAQDKNFCHATSVHDKMWLFSALKVSFWVHSKKIYSLLFQLLGLISTSLVITLIPFYAASFTGQGKLKPLPDCFPFFYSNNGSPPTPTPPLLRDLAKNSPRWKFPTVQKLRLNKNCVQCNENIFQPCWGSYLTLRTEPHTRRNSCEGRIKTAHVIN